MAGNIEGGRKARETNLKRHGQDYYKQIGAIGGRNGHTGGFAADHDRAKLAGSIGGLISSRGKQEPRKFIISTDGGHLYEIEYKGYDRMRGKTTEYFRQAFKEQTGDDLPNNYKIEKVIKLKKESENETIQTA